MKIRLPLLLTLAVLSATAAMGDEITFSFIAVSSGTTVTADQTGLKFGPALNLIVSDAQTGAVFDLRGTVTGNTGMAAAFLVSSSPNLVIGKFDGSGADSVLIQTGSKGSKTILSGRMNDNATLLASYPKGHGAFAGKFDVSFVDPSLLALFGLGPEFQPEGSVSITAAGTQVVPMLLLGNQLQGTIGGGTITITTPVPTPEPGTMGLMGIGLLGCACLIRRVVRA